MKEEEEIRFYPPYPLNRPCVRQFAPPKQKKNLLLGSMCEQLAISLHFLHLCRLELHFDKVML